MSEVLTVLLRINLALAAGVVVVALLRLPARRWFGARAAYGLWMLAPIAALAVLFPARTVATVASVDVGPAQLLLKSSAAAMPVDPAPALTLLWLIGAAAFALHLTIRQRRFLALARRGAAGPAAVGLIRPRMVLPADFETRFSVTEQRAVIAHETAHLKGQHSRINAVIGAAQALFWFNPLVHLGVHLSRLDQELACDEAVVANAPSLRRLYAETLLKTQLAATPLPLGCYWPARAEHPLTERIAMLARPLPSRGRRLTAAALLGAAAAAAGFTAWAAQPPTGVTAPTAATAVPAPAPTPALAQATAPMVHAAQSAPTPPPLRVRPVGSGAPTALNPLPNVVTMPDWVERPTVDELVRFYPAEALRASLSGMARLECTVTAEGRLSDCSVATEAPTDAGFGEAALQLAPMFQMKPYTRDGQPVAGGKVVIPIRFAVN